MANLTLPGSPSDGDTVTHEGTKFTYNATAGRWTRELLSSRIETVVPSTNTSVTATAISGNNLVFTQADGSTANVDLSSLSGGSVTTYANESDLPSDADNGSHGYVTATTFLYVKATTGWYKITSVNLTPAVTVSSNAAAFSAESQTIDVTYTVAEPEDTPVTITVSNTGISNTDQVTITHTEGNNTVSIVSGNTVLSGGTITISASDGVNIGTGTISVDLSLGADWSTTSQSQKITASDAANNDFFGNVVDVDGDYAVVGARGNKAVYIYYYNGSTWSEQQKIQETTFGSNFGHAVSISGDTILVGSNNEDVNSPDGTKAYVYTRSGSTWSLQQKVDPSQAEHDDAFGYQRTMKLDKSNNNQFIAGSFKENDSFNDGGAVYIFNRSGSTWSEQQRIVTSDLSVNSKIGITADISGDFAVFGGQINGVNKLYIWTKSGSTWSQQAALTRPSGHTNNSFALQSGLSINQAGDTIAVGAHGDSYPTGGKVFIFTRSGSTWTNEAVIQPSDTAEGDMFGWECRLDSTGDILIASAKGAKPASLNNLAGGKAYIFTRDGTTWTEQADITASDVNQNWEFGEDVGISGSDGRVIVGARQNGSSQNGRGAAYIFTAS